MIGYSAPGERDYSLDWLRVMAFAILILYHTGMFFVPWGWHVKNPEQSEALTWVMMFFNRWRLPLLFLISGAGVCFSLRKRSFAEFALERMTRLGIPLLFGIYVVVPPQIYFERLWRAQFHGSYLEFWPSVLQGVSYPKGNTSWHHLWFVAYILVFSLVSMPLFALLRRDRAKAAVAKLARFCAKPGAIYLLGLPNIAAALILGPHWPTTHNLVADWANFTGSLLTFLWGYVIFSEPEFRILIEKKRREFLTVALIMTALYYGFRLAGRAEPMLVESYFSFSWIFTILGYARVWLNRDSPQLRYATRAAYPFYIAHQTVTVTIAYFMIPWRQPVTVKLPLLAAGTFLGSWVVFEFARRTRVTRVLFGMKG